MGLQQPRTRSEDTVETIGDSNSGALLDGEELLARLESGCSPYSDGDDDGAGSGDPVAGIGYGLIIGGLFWATGIAAYFIAT